MFVRDCMTRNPIVVRPGSDPLAGIALFNSGGFRHLPVVDAQDRLVGIVARSDLEMFLSKARSPGVIKRQHRMEQVMTDCRVVHGQERTGMFVHRDKGGSIRVNRI